MEQWQGSYPHPKLCCDELRATLPRVSIQLRDESLDDKPAKRIHASQCGHYNRSNH